MAPNDAPRRQESGPINFELEQPEVYGKYMLSTSLDILFVLRSLIKRGCITTVYFDQGRSFLLSSVLAITKDEKSVILDLGGDPAVNRMALKATHLVVTANLDSVKIQFAVSGLRETTFENHPALIAAIPGKLLRLQRREYFRLETSLVNPVRIQIPAVQPDGATQTLNLVLFDISAGGLSLMVPSETVSFFQTGVIFSNCRLYLPGESEFTIDLCVRNGFRVENKTGKEFFRVGCEYMNLSGARLNAIQRFITQVERQRKTMQSGLA